ncbi:hypothetical protein IFM89_031816, partial [Coptis chinensis]
GVVAGFAWREHLGRFSLNLNAQSIGIKTELGFTLRRRKNFALRHLLAGKYPWKDFGALADGTMAIGYAIVVSTTIPLVERCSLDLYFLIPSCYFGDCKNAMLLYRRTTSSMVNTVSAGMFPSHGTKRLASEEFCGEWENKRLNAGDINNHFLVKCRLPQLTPVPTLLGKGKGGDIISRMDMTQQSNGVMEIGCAQTAATTTMHHGRKIAIGMC